MKKRKKLGKPLRKKLLPYRSTERSLAWFPGRRKQGLLAWFEMEFHIRWVLKEGLYWPIYEGFWRISRRNYSRRYHYYSSRNPYLS